MFRFPLLLAIFILLISNNRAAAADSLFFSTLSIRDGLPSNIISAIAQDKNDFIWIGTTNGVCRYDGHHFNIFKKEGSKSLPANEISSLLIDGDFIWVGTWKGLCKINTLTFEVIPVDTNGNNIIRALCKDQDNTVWIGTTTGLIRYTRESLREYNTANSNISHNTIRSIYPDKHGNLWVGTYDKLNKLPRGQNSFVLIDLKGNYKPELKNNLITDIKPCLSTDSLIWVGTETGLCEVNVFSGHYRSYNEKNAKLSNEVIKNIYTDDEGKLWLATDFGLNIFSPKTFANKVVFYNPQLPYSISNNVIWQIMEDSGGVIWFVTSNGLSRLNKYRNYYVFHGVTYYSNGQTIGNQVRSMLITRQGIMWLATQHGALRIDPATGQKKMFDTHSAEGERLLLNNVYALEEDDHGRIWIGTAGGINVWDEPKKKMYSITSNPTNGLITNYISKFTKGTDGSFWVSAWEGGLFKIIGNFENIMSLHFELVGDFGSEKNVSGGNAVWAINYNELFRIDLNTYQSNRILSFNAIAHKKSVNSLYFSKKGNLWAGVPNGLIEYRPQTDTTVFHPLVIGNDVILASVTEDDHGNIWGAAAGFLLKYHITSRQIEIFPLEKDAPLKSFFNGCFTKTSTGEVLFGGDNGYISILSSAEPMHYKPHVFITALEVNNKKINAGEKINGETLLPRDIAFVRDVNLAYSDRSIAIEFSALHYWQPEMNEYAYKLEGLDKQWNYVSGSKNFVVYSNLSPGSYQLMVRGTNNYGIWSDSDATLDITVLPPLFLSKGFILLYCVFAGMVILGALRFYSSRLHLKNEMKLIRMERAHAEEIDSMKQQFFTNISHELRTPISLILPSIQQVLKHAKLDKEDQSLIRLAEKNSNRLLRVVSQILDYRKLENGSLELKISSLELISFCRDLFSMFSDKATRNHIKFTFQTEVETCPIWADPEKIETILYNLLSNAFKFTPPEGRIDLTIKKHPADKNFVKGAVEIKVTDTGIGIAPEDQPKIFERFFQTEKAKKFDTGSGIGLTMVAEYTKLHHGKVMVESHLENGSCFTVILPMGATHFPIDTDQQALSLNLLATKANTDNENSNAYTYDLDSDKPLIMIVEDNTDMIDFLRINLKEHYHLIIAHDGEEALGKTRSILPEVIVSDVLMPVMDGIAFCKKIKENPRTSHIGIILLTAKDLISQKIEGIRVGADAYLTKPFEVELLLASIDHLLKRKQELSSYFKSEILTHPEIQITKENVDDKFVKKVASIIEANIANSEFNVEILSREIGMSSTHLYRKLKSLTHFSAKDIIKKYRLKKASLLLKNKGGNISEIMYEVGFSNLSYFAKCFKAEFGVSPKDYQQKMSKNPQGIDIEINLTSSIR
jgi:signal transduction histidine kinase/ligand-binding sensor domain-containing protein/DNA-binding response OmpR family regulator